MMIRAALFFLFLPFAVSADIVAIRSGEHENFTRLVFSIAEGETWNLNPTEGGYRLTLEGAGDGFDTSEVFERIPRTRIANLEQVGNRTLDLDLACDCMIESFLWRPDRLVLDVKEGVETRVAVQTATLPILLTETPEPVLGISDLPDIIGFENGLTLTGVNMDFSKHETSGTPVRDTMENISGSEVALLDGIARAATQGFLTPNLSSFPDESLPPPTVETIEPAPEPTEDILVNSRNFGPGIGVSTAFDQSLSDINGLIRTSADEHCLPPEHFEIATWGDERTFHEQVAALSEGLAGEFGEEPVDAETDLAKLYLYYGFGAEALAALSLTPSTSQSRQVLFELAKIFDEVDTNFPLLASQSGCDSAGAFWAFLATPILPDSDDQLNRITRTFFELPNPLRGHIAPRLSQNFLTLGMPETAELVLRTTENQDSEDVPAVQETHALIAEHNQDTDEALAILNEQADDDVRLTPDAAIKMVDLSLEQGIIPSESDLLLLSAFALEFDGHEIGQTLVNTEAKGWSARGDFSYALNLFSDNVDATSILAKNEIYIEMTEDAPSGIFLDLVINDRPSDLSPKTENLIARRLIDLGFPEQALGYLSGIASREDAAERRYLKAEAESEAGNFEQSITALQGMRDERSRNLRATAYSGLGDYQNALEALSHDQDESSLDLQFRAEAWERLSLQEDTVLSNFAQSVVTDSNAEEVATLADRRSLLSQSQESRRAVEDLLFRFDGAAQNSEQP